MLDDGIYFFKSSPHRRAPHSFPTRRSSDLATAETSMSAEVIWNTSTASDSLLQYSTSRSEEHTSELQSPCNLVCRLLLEKKTTRKRASTQHHCSKRETDRSTSESPSSSTRT